jgi:hypothetical protein
LSSKSIIDLGGSSKIESLDFKTPVDSTSEMMAYDFLLHNTEKNLANIKPKDHYLSIIEDAN